MSYIKQQWKTGDVISAEKLNHIESGLEAVDKEQGPAGITPQLQNSGTAIQVSYNEGESYSDLVQLSEITGPQGPAGEGFAIYKTYASVEAMEADVANVEEGKFVMISSTEEDPDNAKLYVKAESGFNFVTDLSGAQGIQGPQGEPGEPGPQGQPGKDGVTPNITVEATQLAYDQEITVVKSGTDAEPHFTFGIPAGQPGKDAELPDNLVTYSDFTYGDQQRKTIQLANYDSISGLGTDGTGYNIAMVSKWDKVDLGAAGLTMNLNSKDGQVQINDEKIVATVDQIPDISNLATKDELLTPEQVVASEPMQNALESVRSEIPTMAEIATSPEVSGLTQGLATEASVEIALEGKQDKGDYALKSELPEIPEALPNPNALTIKYNGQTAFTYDGSKAETGNFVVNATTVPMSDTDSKTIAQALAEKQATGDYATNEVVQAEFESYDKTIKTYIEQQVAPKADQVEVDSLDSRVDVVESISGNVYTMQSQIAQLIEQVQQLKTPTVEPVEISTEQPTVDQPDQDVSFNATVSGTVGTITAKSIQSTNASIESGRLAATATNDVSIKNLSTSGDLAKSTANAGLSVNTNEYVTITGADWQQTGYNGIEVGLSSAPKSVLIDSVDFKSTMSNNAISIFSWQENAVITISNCHFANVSNPLRLSNRDNKPCTINIVNCTCDQWVEGEYAGFICMQDYTSSSAQAAQEANQFGKLTINFVNCSGPDGRIVGNAQQLAENHIIYVYTNHEGLIAYGDGSRYPTVTAQ